MFRRKREPTAAEVKKILKLLESEDPFKENGGICYLDGTVTSEHNYALCRSAILLDLQSYDWKKVKFLWICAELPAPPGYVDDCCSGCEATDTDRLKLAKFDYAEFCSAIPRKDYVSTGQGEWAKKFGIPVVVYQRPYPNPAKGEELGTWDIYDPIASKEEKAIGINLGQLSKLAGSAAVEDLQHLDTVARIAIEERNWHEAAIHQAWLKYKSAIEAGLLDCETAYRQLERENQLRDYRLQEAIGRINRGSVTQFVDAGDRRSSGFSRVIPQANFSVPTIVRQPVQSFGRQQLSLPSATASLLESPVFTTPPIEAFKYVEVQVV